METWDTPVPYGIGTNKQPDNEYFFIPGIYQTYEKLLPNREKRRASGFAMITSEANETICHIHNHGDNKHRMPLFVSLEMAKQWISPKGTLGDFKEIIHYRLPAEELNILHRASPYW
ncbi:SOS response-associated peptidase family protein [Chitinophaga rhizophila]|uniref:SOS response-associated peptidase n=1 Tax=Chitinophaga rhizophila TaxID=2866212 RepID=A0ABS7GIP3_9BACT|nr:SOS response-associated peptidase family protein [Chitinophaga rhizophila]MBW8687276.1 SOS response-associated peptidase [Chitinophaga rhizophila]